MLNRSEAIKLDWYINQNFRNWLNSIKGSQK